MPELYFQIGADFDRVKQLKKEIKELEVQLTNTDKAADPKHVREMERSLSAAKREFRDLSDAAALAAAKMQGTMQDTAGFANSMKGQIQQIGGLMTGMFAANGLVEFGQKVVQVRGEMQQLEVAFKTMLGSEERANDLLVELTRTAASTPFEMKDVTNGAKSLMAYGVSAEEVNKTLVTLGDIAAGMSIPLGDMAQLYGTTMVQGRMFTQDLRQFQGRGIPIAEALADVMGTTADKVGDLVTAGKVGAEEFKAAIFSMTAEGGKFGGLMDAQSKTITGQISNLKDGIDAMFNDIGKQSEGMISTVIGGLNTLVENYETVGKVIMGLVGTYGAYKAVLMATSAVQGVVRKATYKAESAELEELLEMKERSIDSDMQEAVSKGQLTEAEAAHVMQLRAEAAERVKQLQTDADAAKQAADTLNERLEQAQEEYNMAEQMVLTASKERDAALAAGDAVKAEAMQKEAAAAAQIKDSAAKQANTLRTEANAASAKANAAQQKADAAATKLNTASKVGASKATNVLKMAQAQLNATILANPYVAVTAAILAFGYAVYKVATYETETQKATKAMNAEFAKAEASAKDEMDNLNKLKESLDPLKEGTQEYADAKQQLLKLAEKYDQSLINEINKGKDLTNVYNSLSAAIRRSAMERALTDYNTKESERYQSILSSQLEDIQDAVNDKVQDAREAARVYQEIIEAMDKGLLNVKSEVDDGSVYVRYIADIKDGSNLSEQAKEVLQKSGNGFREDLFEYIEEARQHQKNLQLGQDRFFKETDGAKIQADAIKVYQTAAKALEDAEKSGDADRLREAQEDMQKALEGLKLANLTEEQAKSQSTLLDEAKKRFSDAADAYVAAINSGDAKRLEEAKEAYSAALTDLTTKGGKKELVQTYAQSVAIAKQAMDEAEKMWKDAEKNGESESNVLGLRESYKLAKKAYDDIANKEQKGASKSTVKDDTKEREAAAKQLGDIMEKMEAETQKRTTNAMAEGHAKRMQVIEDNHNEEVAKLRQQAEQIAKLNATAKTKDAGQTVNVGGQDVAGLTAEQVEAVNKLVAAEQANYTKSQAEENAKLQETENEYLKEYGKYQERRLAIEREYDAKIALEQDEWARKSLTEEKSRELADLDFQELKGSEAYARAFADVGSVGTQTLQSLRTQLELHREDIQKNLSPDQMKAYADLINNITNEIEGRNPFTSLADGIRDFGKAQKTLGTASKNLTVAQERFDQLQKEAELDASVKDTEEWARAQDDLTVATAEYNTAEDDTAKAQAKIKKSVGTLKQAYDQYSSSLNVIGDTVGGVVGDTIKAMDTVVNLVMTCATAMTTTSTSAAGAIRAVETASVILAIIGAVMQAVQVLVSVFDKEDKSYDKLKDQYEALVDVWDTLIDRKKEYISIEYGDEAKKAAEEAQEILASSTTATQNMIEERLNGQRSKNSHSYGYKMKKNMNAAAWDELLAAGEATGFDAQSIMNSSRMTGLADLTAEQWKYLQEHATTFWTKMDGDVRAYAETIIANAEEVEEINDSLSEATMGQTFDDFRSDWLSTLSDMSKSGDDFAEDFSDSLRQAVLTSMLATEFNEQLEAVYKKMNTTLQSDTLTEAEKKEQLAAARAELDAISAEAEARREEWSEALGLDTADNDDQEASSGAFSTMSEDTASELNGRFTALQISGEAISQAATNIQSIATSIQDIMAQSYLELAQIRDNTFAVVEPIRTMQAEITKIRKKVDEI